MASENTIQITGMIGRDHTYFADSPVVVNVEGLQFPPESPIKVCRLHIIHDGEIKGEFMREVGDGNLSGESGTLTFDISPALRAIWAEYDFGNEVSSATSALTESDACDYRRNAKAYQLQALTEYIDSTDGSYSTTLSPVFDAGWCIIGGMTEMERLLATGNDVYALRDSNLYNGNASTKPHMSPERVGSDSITSRVDFDDTDPSQSNTPATVSTFYPATSNVSFENAPVVLRDSIPYVDFLFVNRRGAVETCSAHMLEEMDISVESTQYTRTGRPSFTPERSIIAITAGGRKSWSMSSGHQTREWAEWWVMEFLMAKKRWMRYNGIYLPVTVTPAKKQIAIYDRTKQQMPSVDFTVTLSLKG